MRANYISRWGGFESANHENQFVPRAKLKLTWLWLRTATSAEDSKRDNENAATGQTWLAALHRAHKSSQTHTLRHSDRFVGRQSQVVRMYIYRYIYIFHMATVLGWLCGNIWIFTAFPSRLRGVEPQAIGSLQLRSWTRPNRHSRMAYTI